MLANMFNLRSRLSLCDNTGHYSLVFKGVYSTGNFTRRHGVVFYIHSSYRIGQSSGGFV